MRISDWSSDVCSSDLLGPGAAWPAAGPDREHRLDRGGPRLRAAPYQREGAPSEDDHGGAGGKAQGHGPAARPSPGLPAARQGGGGEARQPVADRSEKRRVGEGGVSTGRTRGWAEHAKKK